MTNIDWKGSTLEELDLLAAVQHNCTCSFDRLGACSSICPGHSMLLNDQRALDGLLWHRHLRNRLLAEEGEGAVPLGSSLNFVSPSAPGLTIVEA